MKKNFSHAIMDRKHVAYYVRSARAASADPAVARYVRLGGKAFPSRPLVGDEPANVVRNLLTGLDPRGRRDLRWKRGAVTKYSKDSMPEDRLRTMYGADMELSVSKSISIPALMFGDETAKRIAYESMSESLEWLSRKAQRRTQRCKEGKKESITAYNCAFVTIPEKASRRKDPHVHMHGVFANATRFENADGATEWCSMHFREMAKSVKEARNRLNRRMLRRFQREGYAVEFDGRICSLPSVPKELVKLASKGRNAVVGTTTERAVEVSSTRLAEFREKANRKKPAAQRLPISRRMARSLGRGVW